jgi:hypothetical protein
MNQEVIDFLDKLIREAESLPDLQDNQLISLWKRKLVNEANNLRHKVINRDFDELMLEIETTLKGSVEPRTDRGEPEC